MTGGELVTVPDGRAYARPADQLESHVAHRASHVCPVVTRRDIERLFGVGKVRAAALMKTFGAELVGNRRTLPRTKLLQQLKKHPRSASRRTAARAWSPICRGAAAECRRRSHPSSSSRGQPAGRLDPASLDGPAATAPAR